MNNSSAKSGGVSVLGVIQIVFIILKLVGVISWSWWVVLIPLWITTGLILFLALCTIAIAMLEK